MYSSRPRNALKRGRDHGSDSEEDRYLKKSRPTPIHVFNVSASFGYPQGLALRPSLPPSPPRADPSDLEPIQHDFYRPASPTYALDTPIDFSRKGSIASDADTEMEMDETDFDMACSPPPFSPPLMQSLHPPPRPTRLDRSRFMANLADGTTGRLPTPMYPTFPSQNNNMIAVPCAYNSGVQTSSFSNHHLLPTHSNQHTTPQFAPKKCALINHDDRSIRMPSPISEDEDFPDTPTGLTSSQLSRLSVKSTTDLGIAHTTDSSMSTPPPGVMTTPMTGRKRSGALSGRGRWCMGYRDDCEKCRQRVPGHHAHFLPC
ncbi:hypothetical protein M011DRAFT_402767 [Sporormia fimetaria CBS 119925]|uniref:Uncharacterized protein n=1 Tax=Sporormia fimetaria CBS 119925 TaxID=1340428 RepID=A0A6A6V9U4_9PLEO|nr:hypothetical protein M011DRAFT_402767 [Sporormia fimetaria CBS 119925]